MQRSLVALALLAVAPATASADGEVSISESLTAASFDPEASSAVAEGVTGPGMKVGEGTVVYPVLGLSTGLLSNVFYEDTDTNAAGVLRLYAQIGAGSLSMARLTPTNASGPTTEVNAGDFQYRASLRASFDFLLSGNDTVTDQGGLGLGASLKGLTNPMGTWSFGFEDNFNRLIRAANFETSADTNRDINNLSLNLIYHPTYRSIGGYLYYNNTIDIFERSEQSFADRIQHRFGIHPMWRILPQTVWYIDASLGVYSGLGGDAMKVDWYPLVAQTGIATLLSPKTTVNVHAGYTNGFYSAGPSYSSVTAGAQVGYRYTPLGRAALTYDLRYEDSVNANYYRDHVIRLWVEQLFTPFAVVVQPEIHLREYNGISAVSGPPTRDDVILSVIAGLRYNLRNSMSISLDYHFSAVQTDYRYISMGMTDDPSYVRHQLLLNLLWAL